MLKLKIGQNYLLLNYNGQDEAFYKAIAYMVGCFAGTNKIAYYIDGNSVNIGQDVRDVIKIMNESRSTELYMLSSIDYLHLKRLDNYTLKETMIIVKRQISSIIKELKELKPDLIVKVISINDSYNSNEYRAATRLVNFLRQDKTNILSALPMLETYKFMSKRHAAIPKELEVITNDIKRMEKDVKICDRKITLKSVEYLHLIKDAKIQDGKLYLTINKLPINLSEKMGEVFNLDAFRTNPYMFKAASYIYQGCHFRMPETIIYIDRNFRPCFVETLDKRFDKMFNDHNWSTIGYPHFGVGHLCQGEFNDAMAHGKEYGLEYYLLSLKQYLTTANMRDCAGIKVWWFPIYDKDEKLVYCAGMDILMEEYLKVQNRQLYDSLLEKDWEERATMLANYNYRNSSIMRYNAGNYSYSYKGPDAFLQVCKDKDIDLYNKIMEGAK